MVVPPTGVSHLGFISQEHFPNEFTSGDGKKGMVYEISWWASLSPSPGSAPQTLSACLARQRDWCLLTLLPTAWEPDFAQDMDRQS